MTSQSKGPYKRSSAILLWLGWIFGFGGLHRIYFGKPVSGVLYLLTWGLFGIGQVIDLLGIDGMVDEANHRRLPSGRQESYRLKAPPAVLGDPTELARMKLLNAAKNHGNALSVSQGVLATGKTFKEVEAMLDEMAGSGYVGIDNDPDTGAVIYTFGELG